MEIAIRDGIREAIRNLYNSDAANDLIQIQETRRDFSGDFTLVVFPLLRFSKNTPEQTGKEIGNFLIKKHPLISGFNVIKGFLNIEVSDRWWVEYFRDLSIENDVFRDCRLSDSETILVEYSSPNTNKPLHLGHIRNNLLGYSLYRILTAAGQKVIKTNIVNDRGIHICKSMLAWLRYGNGETPVSSGIKGDHLVGRYYVIFEKEYKTQVELLKARGMSETEARNSAPLMQEARKMLLRWEEGDEETVAVWQMMNRWVYEGFEETYKALGVDFDKIYYESDTYKKGKEIVLAALKDKHLYSHDDNSVWADLTSAGLDHKVLLRSDGTAVYITQDLGTAVARFDDYRFDKTIYVVGNEQNYHFQVLRAIMKKIGYEWADGLIHFSYGMVELPDGRMKSREGTTVDADDIIKEMKETAREVSLQLGKLTDFNDEEKEEIFRKIGLGALKYFMLKVDPHKNMTFNPEESIDFNGNTGSFIQYTYARIRSVYRKAEEINVKPDTSLITIAEPGAKEIELIKLLRRFSAVVREAATVYSPAMIANYCYELSKAYNQFYHDFTILGEEDPVLRNLRLLLSGMTGRILFSGMWLLGIEMPDRM